MRATASNSKTASLAVTQTIFIGRSLRHSIRNAEAMITAMVLPIMLMLLFTYVFGGALDPSGQYVNYVVPGIILLCAGFGSSSTAVDISQDMTNGIIDRFRTMPIQSISVITGHVVASLARNMLATFVVIAVALLVGFRPSAGLLDWILAIGLIALFIFAFTWLYAAIGLVAGSPAAAGSYGFALLFLPYLSSAFVPTETMPTWLQGIASYQPITPVIESIRGLLTGGSVQDHIGWAIGWCLFILVASMVWGMWTFKRKAGRR
ncbi:ABC transporter permease [Paenibacillus lautus]|uniref:ABC transporter permease n=1 Tax=Paenibacillus TaxID=44249 RepID=UPI001C7D7C3D|nr:ABC transporter permease [Paenibacillus lautus]MBX4146942.1 ABC transporter permease [Paenibacillus lautus]